MVINLKSIDHELRDRASKYSSNIYDSDSNASFYVGPVGSKEILQKGMPIAHLTCCVSWTKK